CRCVARTGSLRRVVPPVPEAALAGSRSDSVFRQAALAPCLPPPALAGGDQPAGFGADLADRDDRRADAAAARRGAPGAALRRELHAALGAARPEVRLRRAARR